MEAAATLTRKNILFDTYFSTLKDPRRTGRGNHIHQLSDIIFLAVAGILCGAGNWQLIELFGNSQLGWLRKYGCFQGGCPSADTLERVFSALSPESFNSCFINWAKSLRKTFDKEVVSIDGKSICGAGGENGVPHIVSAFASENRICLGQVKVGTKTNEITAIPELLDMLFLEGSIVTIDAMGCQTKIAKQIADSGAEYILAVKGNQPELELSVHDTALLEKPDSTDTQLCCGHGRVETRICCAYGILSHIEDAGKWAGLKSIVKVTSSVYFKKTGKTTEECRFYISSLKPDAALLNKSVRSHWAIENNLHWNLDVIFGEDSARKREGNEAQNFNMLMKMAMAALSKSENQGKKLSTASKQLKAALDLQFRDVLIQQLGLNAT